VILTTDRHALLRLLHPTGYRDLRALDAKKRQRPITRSVHASDLLSVDAFAHEHQDKEIYVGVASRLGTGRNTNACAALYAVFAEQDYKDSSEAEARARLASFACQPSAVVASGGGLHNYWLLTEPLDLTNGGAAKARLILRALATALGADMSAAEPARILRVPGTHNHKYDPAREVTVERLEPERRYSLAQLAAVLPAPKTEPRADASGDRDERLKRARAYADAMKPATQGEHGDTHTFVVACRIVRGFDLTDDEAFSVLQPWNSRCAPPWSEDDLREKIANARAHGTETFGARIAQLVLDQSDPMHSARELVRREHTADGIVTLRHQAAVFYNYEPHVGAYGELETATARALTYLFLEGAQQRAKNGDLVPFKPNQDRVGNVLDALKAVTNLPITKCPPCWLQNDPGLDVREVLAFPNGLLHVPTRRMHLRTPDFFTLNALEFPYDPYAPSPVAWLAFLTQLFPDDDTAIETLQEMFGYLLTPDTAFQKAFMVVGPKRSGKGTIARILRRLIGERNSCNPTLSSFAESTGRQVLIGKTLAVISDARISHKTDTAKVAETLLGISGEDAQTVRRKYLVDWNGELYVRFFLLTNELPQIVDASGALASRFVLLALTESFFGKEDLGLFQKLVRELPGILLWALDGRARLYARGHFQVPESAKETMQQLEDLSSPVGVFVRTHTISKPGAYVVKKDLFASWGVWCEAHGIKTAGTDATFARNLRAVLPGLREKRVGPRGEQEHCWLGVMLNPDVASDM
jgi:putative DNA primase/helicase